MKKIFSKIFRKLYLPIIKEALAYLIEKERFSISSELQRRALISTANYVELKLLNSKAFDNKFKLLEFSIDSINHKGLYLEFGVWKGRTINFIADKIDQVIYGFDSFQGLPEDWRVGYERELFKLNKLPKVKKNVMLVQGYFKNTIPQFLSENKEKIAFMHIDCDLYSSTKDIFTYTKNRLINGTVIVFDEYFNYPDWENGEYKAFQEYIKNNNIKYNYLGYCHNDQQVALIITDIK